VARLNVRLIALIALVLGALASPAWAGPPTEALQGYVTRVLTVLDDPAMREPQNSAARHKAVRAIADEGFDFQEASRRALGPAWNARTPAERARFVELFTGLIDGGYFSKVAGYNGEKISYDTETTTGNESVVPVKVTTKSGKVTPVVFRLVKNAEGRWRVYDAAFEGMSLVTNYRAQFARVLKNGSYQELVTKLEERVEALRKPK